MNKKRIAHISDLHVGHENRGLDMCPHELTPSQRMGRNENYLGSFEDLVESAEFKSNGPIDMLCITGDISNRAHADEFKCADSAIQRIAKIMNIPNDAIYFVPGNHDVHWPAMSLEPKEFWFDYRYAPLLQDGLTFQTRTKQCSTGAIDKSPFFVAWDSNNTLVVGINSAAYDGPDNDLHPGEVRQETVDRLDEYLNESSQSEKIRICLIHHHPFQYSEPIPNSQDHTIVINSEKLLDVLTRHKFDLVMHGHKHQPRLKTHFENNTHPYVSFCAGSFSAVLHPLYFEGVSNLFHVVDVHGRDIESGGIKGVVQSWSHKQGKWQPSRQTLGMSAIESFGSHSTPLKIRADIKLALESLMTKSGVFKWTDIIKCKPDLKYARREIVFNLLKEVSLEFMFDMVGEVDGSTAEWAIFPRSQL